MRITVLILIFCLYTSAYSQSDLDTLKIDTRYFEDQFYTGFTYNFVLNAPAQVNQRNFSYGLQLGFIKDIPVNQKRNVGFGLGFGFGLNTYYTNIKATETQGGINYTIADASLNLKRSKIETYLLEVPFEFRWRDSNPTNYSFWRIYAGIKLGYIVRAKSKAVISQPFDSSITDSFHNTDVQNFQYGLTFNFGYHNFNIHFYYALSNLFNNGVVLDQQTLNITPLRVGFIFYML